MGTNQDMYGEICQCGHLKECHQAHTLDPNGGNCQHCDCDIYTWKAFVYINKKDNSLEVKNRGRE